MSSKHPPSREFCVVHLGGRVTDAEMHAELLENEEADLATRQATALRLLDRGWARDQVCRLYGLPPDFERPPPEA